MLAVGISCWQTIRAYPQGGGSYIVASEELGRVPGLMAAAGLLLDYVMTVAVSIAPGVAAITSAYPPMQPATGWIGAGVIVILLAGNLRGARQAGAMFAVPTYAFIAAIAALVSTPARTVARSSPRVSARGGPRHVAPSAGGEPGRAAGSRAASTRPRSRLWATPASSRPCPPGRFRRHAAASAARWRGSWPGLPGRG